MNERTARLGYVSALLAFLGAAGYSVVQLMQVAKLVAFPWDAILIYGTSLCIAPAFMVAMVALHYSVPEEKRAFTQAAMLFATMYATFVSFNYVVQLGTVIPATLRGGELGELKVLDQTPHSLFWDADALGYFCMAASMLLAAKVFDGEGVQRWTRRFFLANAAVTPLIGIVYFYPHFSIALLFLGLPWVVTAPGAIFTLMLYFREQIARREGQKPMFRSAKPIAAPPTTSHAELSL